MTFEIKDELIAQKAKSQPHFTLLAQDITADLLVDIWVMINDYMEDVKGDMEPKHVVEMFREMLDVPYSWKEDNLKPRVKDAAFIAEEMRQYSPRKAAD